MTAREEWRVLARFPDYEVSSRGRVRRLTPDKWDRRRKVLRQHFGTTNYPQVGIYNAAGKQVTCKVHALVAEAFVGPRPAGLDIRHLDGNSRNPSADNLTYGTRAENEADKVLHGRANQGARHGMSRLTEAQAVFALNTPLSIRATATELGVSRACVRSIRNGASWKHLERECV